MKAQSVTTGNSHPREVATAIYRTGRSFLQELETFEGTAPPTHWTARVLMYVGTILEETNNETLCMEFHRYVPYFHVAVHIESLEAFLRLWSYCSRAYSDMLEVAPSKPVVSND